MYNNLVEKQQRHFNDRLTCAYWKKEEDLRKACLVERTYTTLDIDPEKYNPVCDRLEAAKRKAQDIIMIGDPVKMFEAVDAFEKMTIH